MKAAQAPAPGGGSQQIRRLEAKGGVIVTQKDQTATGDTGMFDMRANTVTLTGQRGGDAGPERAARRAAGRRSHDRDSRVETMSRAGQGLFEC